ncbi:MAG TPA: TIGR01777 family oxidoreductase [bacterium]|jgi:uncharacterized protein (TIGR01777 family)|nr:TIGR01777 family oxidoreductase [bacterium]
MRILVTGASGFFGRQVVAALGRNRHEVLRLTRGSLDPADPRLLHWDPSKAQIDERAVQGLDAVIHLAGEGIADARWSDAYKQRLRDSRILGTRLLVDALAAQAAKPRVLLAASAVGYYGDRGSEELSESSRPGAGFLASLCVDWEAETARAAALGLRVVQMRLGVVLGLGGGVLKKTATPFKMGLGGKLGNGRQWMSWIAAPDAVRALLLFLERERCSGAYNLCSPNPVTNAQYTQSLRRAFNRPALMPVPAFVLRLAFGEMADSLLLASQKVLPLRLKGEGFTWGMPYVGEALNRLLQD